MTGSLTWLQIFNEDRNAPVPVDATARFRPSSRGTRDRQGLSRSVQPHRVLRQLIKQRVVRDGAVESHQALFAAAVRPQIAAAQPLAGPYHHLEFRHD